jgi:Predicted periplasmic protein (DUF2092)
VRAALASRELTPSGEAEHITFTRETVIRRPNRIYSKTSGDAQNELWYDGVGMTFVMHKDKDIRTGPNARNDR